MYYNLGHMTVYTEPDYAAMSARAADIFAEAIKGNPGGCFGFATGSTPLGLYKELIDKHINGGLDFSGITSFNLDEYYPITADNSQSYRYFMEENLFKHVNISRDKINIPNGEALFPEEECIAYDNKIKAAGGIDMQLLGLGANGHIGFNEPCDFFPGGTHMVDLTESTIEANSRFFQSREDVPRKALTMGIKAIMAAKTVLLIASGENKSRAVADMLLGKITPQVPASVLQLHHNVIVVTDAAAYEGLRGSGLKK